MVSDQVQGGSERQRRQLIPKSIRTVEALHRLGRPAGPAPETPEARKYECQSALIVGDGRVVAHQTLVNRERPLKNGAGFMKFVGHKANSSDVPEALPQRA